MEPFKDEIAKHIAEYICLVQGKPAHSRARSWDICFTHFRGEDAFKDKELAAAHLMSYMASWGMFRGSSWLGQNANLWHFEDIVHTLEQHHSRMKTFDIDDYTGERVDDFLAAWDDIAYTALPVTGDQIVVVSKIMLGVWGAIPAFDTYFGDAFKRWNLGRKTISRAGLKTVLQLLKGFYDEYAEEFDEAGEQYVIHAKSDGTYVPSDLTLPKAKILDMFGFSYGQSISR